MVPSNRLLLYMGVGLVVAAGPMIHGPIWPAVVGFWAVLAAASTYDIVSLVVARPHMDVVVPKAVGVGDNLVAEVKVSLRGRRRLGAELVCEVQQPLFSAQSTETVVEPGATVHDVEVNAPLRGKGAVLAVWSRLSGPLGFFRSIRRHPLEPRTVSVVPNVEKLRRYTMEYLADPLMRQGQRMDRSRGEGTEFDSLQAYASGMDMRQVDWKTSARHNALRVRRFRHERNQRMLVCVDTGRLMASPIDGTQRIDHSIHAGLLVAQAALRNKDLVGFHAYGSAPRAWVPPGSGLRQASKIQQVCAGLKVEAEETNHALGLHSVLSRLRRRTLIVIFTEFTDSTTGEIMIEYLGQLARKHLVIFVALDEPELERPYERQPSTVEHMAEAVAAAGLRQSRRTVLRRLEHAGVRVIHGSPGRAALDLLAAYLDIKKRGLLG